VSDKLFNSDHLRFLCEKYGLQPSKKYGQNFLIDPEPIEKMILAAEIKKTDAVVEIGPGFGVLTFALAERAKKVLTFEIEKKLENYWRENVPDNVEIIWGNVLNSPLLRRGAIFLARGGSYKVAANLPYQITSPVIRAFLEAENPPETMVLMVQKEVAERICAKPGDMSVLSVAVQYYAEPKIIAIVPRANFWPEPKVDSAIIVLKVYKVIKFIKSEEFFRLVKAGFANRRKFLIKNLLPVAGKKNKDELKKIFASIGLSETARAQELSVEKWQALRDLI